jgi:hypothetical protein
MADDQRTTAGPAATPVAALRQDDERQKLPDDLERYQTLRQLVTDQQASAAIEEQITETRDRLAQLENELGGPYLGASPHPDGSLGLSLSGGSFGEAQASAPHSRI